MYLSASSTQCADNDPYCVGKRVCDSDTPKVKVTSQCTNGNSGGHGAESGWGQSQ